MYRIDYLNKLRDKSASFWSFLRKLKYNLNKWDRSDMGWII